MEREDLRRAYNAVVNQVQDPLIKGRVVGRTDWFLRRHWNINEARLVLDEVERIMKEEVELGVF